MKKIVTTSIATLFFIASAYTSQKDNDINLKPDFKTILLDLFSEHTQPQMSEQERQLALQYKVDIEALILQLERTQKELKELLSQSNSSQEIEVSRRPFAPDVSLVLTDSDDLDLEEMSELLKSKPEQGK